MKKLVGFLFIVVIISACRKVDNSSVFGTTPDQRLNAKMASYQALLTSGAPNGWKASITTGTGGTYTFYFKFNDSNRVRMYSSFDSTSAVTLKESSYRLKALQQPSLIFDTYSYLHVLADPNANNNGGYYGAGLVSDFEFLFDDSTTKADTVGLIGRWNNTRMKMVKATPQELAAFNSGQLAAGLAISKILTYYKRFVVSGTDSTDGYINLQSATITRPDAQGNLLDASRATRYTLNLGGLSFLTPMVVGTKTINELRNINYNAATSTITATAGGVPVVIKGVAVPIRVDVAAPQRWYNYAVNNGNSYWASGYGFHVNGVDDAFGITNLTSAGNTYYSLAYWPKYATTYDLFAPIFLNAAQTQLTLLYGTAPRFPTFTTDGRAVFTLFGNLGTYPTTGAAAQSRALLYNTAGYYFVQTGALSYDMVGAADGRAWITWEW
jgi:hypothetical protein